jgi:XTP/dITP diphosphohydrolase
MHSNLNSPPTIIVATRNQHKVQEIQNLLGGLAVCRDLTSVSGAPILVEDAPDFAGNAIKKAMGLAAHLCSRGFCGGGEAESKRMWVLADDSGLEVDALGCAPGVHSARFAAPPNSPGNATDAANRAKLLHLLERVPAENRQARFHCVLALVPVGALTNGLPAGSCSSDDSQVEPELFDGVCEGSIGFIERGTNGFGYDSLFVPQGFDRTFAELGEDTKNSISHRARAMEKLKHRLVAG